MTILVPTEKEAFYLGKIGNLSIKNTIMMVESYLKIDQNFYVVVIPSPWLKKMLKFDFLKHPRMA